MDPQWNYFQPSESALLDYNDRPLDSSQRSNSRSNALYDSILGSRSISLSSNQSCSQFSQNNYLPSTGSSLSPSRGMSYSSQSNYFQSSSSQYFPPVNDFKIGTFSLSPNGYSSESSMCDSSSNYNTQSNGLFSNSNSSSSYQNTRETGIIEKLLQTYGFIQCCERQARLFFHFSQFDGNSEHLRIGDPVEFEVTFDRRTGKPIASSVSKISPEVVLSEERVTGLVTTELRTESGGEQQGRITYENRGECFFLPYCKEDVEGYVTLKPGDKVSFQIATNQRTGNLAAHHVRLENPVQPVKYQGVVSGIKDSYGFIERADVVDEIFFHFSEIKNINLKLGDDVEFFIQTRNGKEVATDIKKLSVGTVVFEDIDPERIRGQVLKPVEKNLRQNQKDPLTGRIRYRAKDRSEAEVKFGERDQKGDFSLRHGDWVEFNIATDRRDHLQKATRITLLDESFTVSGEKREQGIISVLKDGYGYIDACERDTQIYFQFSELLDPEREIFISDEVVFTVNQDYGSSSPNHQGAIRIQQLEKGTVRFEVLSQEGLHGQVISEAVLMSSVPSYSSHNRNVYVGKLSYQTDFIKQAVNFHILDSQRAPLLWDKVKFNIYQIKKTKEYIAKDIDIIEDDTTKSIDISYIKEEEEEEEPRFTESSDKTLSSIMLDTQDLRCLGYIVALKDTFGFIETSQQDREVFFHYSNLVESDPSDIDLGQEVEYTLSQRGNSSGKVSAECVKILEAGTIPTAKMKDEHYEGIIVRPLRSVNPDQQEYCGLLNIDGDPEKTYKFGIMGLNNKRELLQKGDKIAFNLNENDRAVNIECNRKKVYATVDAVKGQYGFLSYDTDDGKKLFFHQSEVKDGVILSPGDEVEFVVITNQKTGKSSACNILRILSKSDATHRPNRLVSKLKNLDSNGPRVTTVRQPKGPDGTTGFQYKRLFDETE